MKKRNDKVAAETPAIADSVSGKKRSASPSSTLKLPVKKPRPSVPGFKDSVKFSYEKDVPLVSDRMSCAHLTSQVKMTARPISDFTKLKCSDQYQEFAQSVLRMIGFANSMVYNYEKSSGSFSEEFDGMARAFEDLKVHFANLTSQNTALKDRCFVLETSAEETSQALAAKDRELKLAVAAKDLAIAERDRAEAECARLRRSRADQVAQVVAKGQRRLDEVARYLKEQEQAEETLSIHNQAEGISEMMNLLVSNGDAQVGDGVLDELERQRLAAEAAAKALHLIDPKTLELFMTPDPLAAFAPAPPRSDDAPLVVPSEIDQHGTNVGVIGDASVEDLASEKAP